MPKKKKPGFSGTKATACIGTAASDFAEVIGSARALIKNREQAKALSLLRDNEAKGMASPEFAAIYAATAAAAADDQTRTRIAEVASTAFPASAAVLSAAAQAFEKAGQLAQARTSLEAAVKLRPNDARLYGRLAEIAKRLGDNEAVSAYLRNGVDAVEANTAHFAKLFTSAIRCDNAEAVFKMGVLAAHSDPEAAIEAVRHLLQFEQPERAAEVVEKLPADIRAGAVGRRVLGALKRQFKFARDNNDPLLRLNAAVAIVRLSEQGEGAADGNAVVAASVRGIRAAARELAQAGNGDEAKTLLREAIKAVPSDAVLLKEYAQLCERGGDLENGLEAYFSLSAVVPDEAIKERAVNLARKVNAWDRAIVIQRSILDASPASGEAAERMDNLLRRAAATARGFLAEGRFEEAANYIRAILKEDSQSVAGLSLARNFRKLLHAEIGASEDPEKIGALAGLVLTLHGDDPQALKVRAAFLEQKGIAGEAAEHWEKLAAGDRGRSSHWRKAAKLYRKAGQIKKAELAQAELDRLEALEQQAG